MPFTFDELRVHYGVFHSTNVSRIPRKKVIVTKECVKTDIGEIEISEWKKLIKEAIWEAGEEELFQNLYDWALNPDCEYHWYPLGDDEEE